MTTTLRVVALTQRVLISEHSEVRLALDARWAPFLAACGLVGVPLPIDPALAESAFRQTGCTGLVLTGGDSIGTFPQRDQLEQLLVRFALDHDLPVIGVCRGMQVLVHMFGGTLRRVSGHTATTHGLTGRYGGRTVNSYHDWAALAAPAGFDVMASHGDVVESIQHHTARLIGIMWHPERVEPPDRDDIVLFREFFQGAR